MAQCIFFLYQWNMHLYYYVHVSHHHSISFLGESIFSGQFNNLTVQTDVNITLVPERYSNVISNFFTIENVTVIDGSAKIFISSLCTSTAGQIIDILTTFTSFEISCLDCGKAFI